MDDDKKASRDGTNSGASHVVAELIHESELHKNRLEEIVLKHMKSTTIK